MSIFLTDSTRESLAPAPEPTPGPARYPQLGSGNTYQDAQLQSAPNDGGDYAPNVEPWQPQPQATPESYDPYSTEALSQPYTPPPQSYYRPEDVANSDSNVFLRNTGSALLSGAQTLTGMSPYSSPAVERDAIARGFRLDPNNLNSPSQQQALTDASQMVMGTLGSEGAAPRDPRLLPPGAGGILDRSAADRAAAARIAPQIERIRPDTETLLARAEQEIANGGLTPETHAAILNQLGETAGAAPAAEVQAAQDASRQAQSAIAREAAPLAPSNLEGRVPGEGGVQPPREPPVSGGGLELPPEVPSWQQRAASIMADLVNIPRTTMSAVDISGSLRQGGYLAPSHPVAWKDAMGAQLRSLVSEDAARAVQQEIMDSPMAQYRKTLYQSAWDGSDIGAREEQFMSKTAGNLPGVYQSQRAYSTMLNKFRADVFDGIVSGWAEADRTPKRLETLERWVEASTGRGSLPGFMKAYAPTINAAFFSPRFLASIPERHLIGITDPLIRKEILKSAGGFYATGLTILGGLAAAKQAGLLPGVKLETNFNSPDWGKVVVGNQHIDIWAGHQQFARMMLRVGEAAAKRLSGEQPKAGAGELGIIGQFLRYKFSPVGNLEEQLRTGRPAVGGKLPGAEETVIRMFAPLALQDIYDAYQSGGARAAALTAPLSILGVGVQTQGPASPKAKGTLPKLPTMPKYPKLPAH